MAEDSQVGTGHTESTEEEEYRDERELPAIFRSLL